MPAWRPSLLQLAPPAPATLLPWPWLPAVAPPVCPAAAAALVPPPPGAAVLAPPAAAAPLAGPLPAASSPGWPPVGPPALTAFLDAWLFEGRNTTRSAIVRHSANIGPYRSKTSLKLVSISSAPRHPPCFGLRNPLFYTDPPHSFPSPPGLTRGARC